MGDVLNWQRYSDEKTSEHILAVDDVRDKYETKIKHMKKSEENLKSKIEVGFLYCKNLYIVRSF